MSANSAGHMPATPPAERPLYVRMSRAQGMFGVHRSTIYRWRDQGLLTIHKRGRGVSLIRVAEFEKLVSNRQE